MKFNFLKTKIQNPTYWDFEHHSWANFWNRKFFEKPYILEFDRFFRKKNNKLKTFKHVIHGIFNRFFEFKKK